VIRLGVNVPNFGPVIGPADLLDWAQFADRNGFATAVVSDHVAPTPEVSAVYPDPFYDPFVLISALAGQTTSVRWGTSVLILPYRHPLLTARMSAAIHALSGGRFVLGVGTGWARTEFEALGADFEVRGATSDRYLDIITRAWAGGRVSSDTPGLMFTDVATGPAPAGGRVPLWVGGAGRPALRRVVRFGAAWHPINPGLSWLREVGVPAVRRLAAEAEQPMPELVPRIKAHLQTEANGQRPLGVGRLDQIVGDVLALADLGAAEVILDTNPDEPSTRDFGAEQRHLLEIKDAVQQAWTRHCR
jgi:probable F420-dependent oxidoreductase